jgi:hypothetical protein
MVANQCHNLYVSTLGGGYVACINGVCVRGKCILAGLFY